MENENENWKICCSNSSSHFIKFFITFIICFSVMTFSMIMIINNTDDDNAIYFSLISSILALFMEPPKLEQPKMIKNDDIKKENTDNV